jgi:hypothetical protein
MNSDPRDGGSDALAGASSRGFLDGVDLVLEVLELLLDGGVLLGHLFVLGLPLVALLLEGLDFPLEVAGPDVGLPQPVEMEGKDMVSIGL